MNFLPELTAAQIAEIARSLTITDYVTGTRVLWNPSRIQHEVWRFSEQHRRGFIGKPRRAYVTTAFDIEDVLQTYVADKDGHRIRTGIMLDVEDKVTERMWQCRDFLEQLGIPHRATDFYIELNNGSEIVGLTAGGKRAAASTGFQRMRYSEACYYSTEEAIPAASAAVGKLGREMIETTVDIGAANGRQARAYWDGVPKRAFERLFIPFEWHLEYRLDASAITDEEWARMQGEGFTIREAAAYWLREILPRMGGDVVRAKHEFPQTESDMFSASELLWVRKRPRALEPVEVWTVQSVGGKETWPIFVFKRPELTSGRICITCDSAKGSSVAATDPRKRSRATAIAIDEDDGRLVAYAADADLFGDDQARVAFELYQRYSREITKATGVKEWQRPRTLVEDNTVGQVLIQPLTRIGMPFTAFNTDEGMKLLGMTYAKQAVESGTYEGPPELVEECDECTRDPVTGKFKGRKDLLMSYGFWAARARPQDQAPKRELRTERHIDGKKLVRAQMRRERMGWR